MNRGIALALVLTGLLMTTGARAAVVFSHSGNNDPASEGFTLTTAANSDAALTPVANDQGYDAWQIADTTTASFDSSTYNATPSAANHTAAATDGFVLRARIRALAGGAVSGNAVEYAGDGTNLNVRYLLNVVVDTDGTAIVTVNVNGTTTFDTGSTGYVLYELVYDPGTNNADLYIDGVEQVSDIAPLASLNLNRFYFGDNQSDVLSSANYNLAEFQTGQKLIPEPASLALLGLGTLIAVRRRRA